MKISPHLNVYRPSHLFHPYPVDQASASQNPTPGWAENCVGVSARSRADSLDANMTNEEMFNALGMGHYLRTVHDAADQPGTDVRAPAEPAASTSLCQTPTGVSSASVADLRWLDNGAGLNKVSGRVLQAWIDLRRAGINDDDAASTVARDYGVSRGAIQRYIDEGGGLTRMGERLLQSSPAHNFYSVTPKLLQPLIGLGYEGMRQYGGLAGYARMHGVSVDTLRHYIRANGTLTPRGLRTMNRSVARAQTKAITINALLLHKATSIQSATGVSFRENTSQIPDTR